MSALVNQVGSATFNLIDLSRAWNAVSKALGQLASEKNLTFFELYWGQERPHSFFQCRHFPTWRAGVGLCSTSSGYLLVYFRIVRYKR